VEIGGKMAFNLENIYDDYGATCARCGGNEQKRENKKLSTRVSRKKAAKQKRERSQKRRIRKRAGSGAKEKEESGTADVRYQLKLYEAAQKAAGKAKAEAVRTFRNVVPKSDDTSPCPPTPVASKSPKKCTCKINLVWTSCKGSGTHCAVRGDSFRDRERAEAAAAEYKGCHGWTPFVGLCELCGAFHLYRDPQNKGTQLP
jgi:hypothetical protein